MPATVPPASAISVRDAPRRSPGATSSLVTTSSTLLPASAPSTRAGATASSKASAGVELGLQLLGRSSRRALVLLEGGDLALDVGEDRLVERGGADDDPERDRQEDGDQRDQVVAEVDHEKRFSSQNTKLFHWSSSRSR